MRAPVPVEILFCKTDAILSRAIMWGLDEPVSHLAIDIPECGWVIHSDLLGLHAAHRKPFLLDHDIVATFKVHLSRDAQDLVSRKLLSYVSATEAPYDFGAVAYFAWRAVFGKVTGAPMPDRNPRGDDRSYLCTEAAYLLNQALSETVGESLFDYAIDLAAVSPWHMRDLLRRAAGGENEIWLPRASVVRPLARS